MEEIVVREAEKRLRPGPVPKDFPSVEELKDVESIREKLYRTSELTDEAFSEMQTDISYRWALVMLTALVVSKNIKAIELAIELKEKQLEASRGKRPADRNVTPLAFSQTERTPDPNS